MITRIKFTKFTSLSKVVDSMEIGESVEVPMKFYDEIKVRRCCTRYNNKGYRFQASKGNEIITIQRLA